MADKNTFTGNLTGDPELRFTANGKAVANFTIAHTPRSLDRATNSWKDGEPLFLNVTAWDALGQNTAASLKKGDRVIVVGDLRADSYEDKKTGEKRTSIKLYASDVAPSLQWAQVAGVNRVRGNGGGGNNGGNQGGQPQYQAPQQSQQAAPQGGGWADGGDETPF